MVLFLSFAEIKVWVLLTTITVDLPCPGVKAILSFKVHDQSLGKVGISTSVGLTANRIVNFSGVLGTNLLALGTDVSFDTKSGNFTKCNVGLNFSNADLIASLNLNEKGDVVSGSFYHSLYPEQNIVVGAEVTHRFSNSENTITLGAQHPLDSLTSVKARVNNFGKANALIQHEWRPKSFFTISGEVDTRAIEKSTKIGLALALKP
ncbi:hypothetical protein ACLB2K_068477 [Fragaria x ananassa]